MNILRILVHKIKTGGECPSFRWSRSRPDLRFRRRSREAPDRFQSGPQLLFRVVF